MRRQHAMQRPRLRTHRSVHLDPNAYANKLSSKYANRIITGGVGHNLPQEAPEAFAKAIIEVEGY
jgi:hypothetical protein